MAKALEKNGTTLIYVPIPTKSQVLPELVPERAALYGFDAGIATEIYDDVVRRLNEKGVTAVDIATPMREKNRNGFGEYSFFQADFHWTAHGADVAANAIADRLKALPAYGDVTPVRFDMKEVAPPTEYSSMRELLQKHCLSHVPTVTAHTYEAIRAEDEAAGSGSMDIFGSGGEATIALVGTSYSDKPISNFAGYLENHAGILSTTTRSPAATSSVRSCPTSPRGEFQEQRPRFLIWENPIYNNLGQFGGAPGRKSSQPRVANAAQRLQQPSSAKTGWKLHLRPSSSTDDDVILADIGSDVSRKATFTLTAADGHRAHPLDRTRRPPAFDRPLLLLVERPPPRRRRQGFRHLRRPCRRHHDPVHLQDQNWRTVMMTKTSIHFAIASFAASLTLSSVALADDGGLYEKPLDPNSAFVRVIAPARPAHPSRTAPSTSWKTAFRPMSPSPRVTFR